MDWKDVLGQLKQDGSLPEGTEPAPEGTPVVKKNTDSLHVLMEKKGRAGKVATIVEGFTCDDDELNEIASRLKKKLGVGGSARGGEILVQGNLVEQVRQWLKAEGFKVK